MGVARTPGVPDYEASGANKNIPWIFSKKTVQKFYDASVIPQITNTDYEGEIQKFGSKVIIRTVPNVTIKPYTKGMTVTFEQLESPNVELDIDRAQYFAFKMDAIDIKQFDLDMMNKCSEDASEQMKIYTDTVFLGAVYADAAAANKGTAAGRKSGAWNLGTTGSAVSITRTNVLDYITDCGSVADEQNWPESGRWMVIPVWFANYIKKSDLKDASLTGDGTSLLRNGRIGMIDRFTLYTTNLYTPVVDTVSCYNVMFGHKSGICFATQLVDTQFHEKLESTFGSGMKGLQVYGFKAIKQESLGVLYCKKG